jgi:ATPase subunit of ABC transporter with duplicated ATPase domains
MNPSNSLVIETHHLSKSYQEVEALKGLSLAVKQHSIFGFLAPNGAGKTTTIFLRATQTGVPGAQDGLSPIGHLKLGKYIGDMIADGVGAEGEAPGNLRIGFPAGN